MASITVTFPDGAQKAFDSGVAVIDVANAVSKRLAESAFVAKVDGQLRDLSSKLERDASVSILTDKNA
jgi:threonyl-tRNA synthetase